MPHECPSRPRRSADCSKSMQPRWAPLIAVRSRIAAQSSGSATHESGLCQMGRSCCRIGIAGRSGVRMIRLAANLSFMFTELPFLKRFEAAARAGFRAVEFSFAYDVTSQVLRSQLRDNDLTLVLVNTPAGDMEAGELCLAA